MYAVISVFTLGSVPSTDSIPSSLSDTASSLSFFLFSKSSADCFPLFESSVSLELFFCLLTTSLILDFKLDTLTNFLRALNTPLPTSISSSPVFERGLRRNLSPTFPIYLKNLSK